MKGSVLQRPTTSNAPSTAGVGVWCSVRKAKFAEIEKFERKKTGARTGARHVSWESCQLAAHTRVGRSVGREDRPPQWGVVHEHTPVSIPVFMNTKTVNSNFTGRSGQGETGSAHLSNTRQLPSTGRSVIPCYSAAKKTNPRILAENHNFCRVHENKTQIPLCSLKLAIRLPLLWTARP